MLNNQHYNVYRAPLLIDDCLKADVLQLTRLKTKRKTVELGLTTMVMLKKNRKRLNNLKLN